jgi:DNA-binding NarL/FixJ family response regulator
VAAQSGLAEANDLAMEGAGFVAGRDAVFATASAASTALSTAWRLGTPAPTLAHELLGAARTGMGPGRGTLAAGHLAQAEAWATTAAGDPDPERWRAAVRAWDAAGYRYPEAEAQAMLAAALLATGDRDTARAETVRAWAQTQDLGARALAEQVGAFARRARFPLAGSTAGPGPLDVLTPREREVLALLADGASNRTIAQTLVISGKTAGVHVSNVLAKLGVSSRLEAAAVAHRAGLSDGPSAPAGSATHGTG